MVIMRIHRPSTLSTLTVLKLCEPPFTCGIKADASMDLVRVPVGAS